MNTSSYRVRVVGVGRGRGGGRGEGERVEGDVVGGSENENEDQSKREKKPWFHSPPWSLHSRSLTPSPLAPCAEDGSQGRGARRPRAEL